MAKMRTTEQMREYQRKRRQLIRQLRPERAYEETSCDFDINLLRHGVKPDHSFQPLCGYLRTSQGDCIKRFVMCGNYV